MMHNVIALVAYHAQRGLLWLSSQRSIHHRAFSCNQHIFDRQQGLLDISYAF